MTYKDIYVHVDATAHSDSRVALAAELAQRHDAHLTGIYVIEPDATDPLLSTGASYGNAPTVEASAAIKSRALAVHADKHFRECLAQSGISGRMVQLSGLPEDIVPLRARYADLLIAGQSNPDDPLDFGSRVASRAVVTSGRPALVVPYAGHFDSIATNIVVAWNDSRESARTLNDAMPLLATADKVTVLSVNPPEDRLVDRHMGGATDIALHLSRHGVNAEAARIDVREVAVGDTLLNRAFDLGADLLVSGAYGHSQLRELILGGVTRDLFDHMTVPVFMSH